MFWFCHDYSLSEIRHSYRFFLHLTEHSYLHSNLHVSNLHPSEREHVLYCFILWMKLLGLSYPSGMSLHKLINNIFFDFLDLLYPRICQCWINSDPCFNILSAAIGLMAAGIGSNEDYFKLASMKVVTYDDLVTVSLEGGTSFGYQEFWVCFELKREKSLRS